MNGPHRLSARQQTEEQQQSLGRQQAEHQTVHEFATVEDMLRHDALHTPVPPHIGQRLQASIDQLPAAPRSWWRRLFGGRSPGA